MAVRVRPLGGQERATGSAWKITGPQEISLALDGKAGSNSAGQGGSGTESGGSNRPYLLGKMSFNLGGGGGGGGRGLGEGASLGGGGEEEFQII